MQDVIELLTYYEEFRKTGNAGDFSSFGDWLSNKHKQDQKYVTDQEQVNREGMDAMISYLLGGLVGYAETWVKLAYAELPVIALNDFAILKAVEFMRSPTKKMIVENTVMERSTCIESIKRMVHHGIFSEVENPADKRSKMVMLTPAGKDLMKKVDEKMIALSKLLVGNLSFDEKEKLFPILQKLNNFHKSLYKEKSKEEVKVLFEI